MMEWAKKIFFFPPHTPRGIFVVVAAMLCLRNKHKTSLESLRALKSGVEPLKSIEELNNIYTCLYALLNTYPCVRR